MYPIIACSILSLAIFLEKLWSLRRKKNVPLDFLQEIEQYKGKWIIYGLGNFVFNSPGRYQKRNAKPYSLAAMLNIREITGRFRLTLQLYPIFSDNLITNYQPRLADSQHLQEIRELLMSDNAGARRTTRMPGSSKDEIGWHFTLDLGTAHSIN